MEDVLGYLGVVALIALVGASTRVALRALDRRVIDLDARERALAGRVRTLEEVAAVRAVPALRALEDDQRLTTPTTETVAQRLVDTHRSQQARERRPPPDASPAADVDTTGDRAGMMPGDDVPRGPRALASDRERSGVRPTMWAPGRGGAA